MLHFEGVNEFSQPLTAVWSRLSDLNFLVACVPDLHSATVPSPREATLVVRPGFSFVRGSLNVVLHILEAVENQTLRLHAAGKGIGTSNDVDLVLRFEPHDHGTRVAWTADITNLGGLLKALPKGLLQASAQKVIGDVWARVQERMG